MLSTILVALGAVPAVTYEIVPQTESAEVKGTFSEPIHEWRMPAWAPGDYQIFDYGQFVKEIVFSRQGSPVAAVAEGKNTWKIEGGADSVRYTILPSRGNFSPNLQIREGELFVSGPGVFGYVPKLMDRPHALKVEGKLVSSLKDQAAKTYTSFIDGPFVVGDKTRLAEREVHGKVHRIAAFGQNAQADLKGLLDVAEKAAVEAKKMFGELPYPEYTYFLDFGGRGGGLEHSNSTRIGLRANSSPADAVGIMFHEYFHAFNVKRIRPKGLGPFDFSKPAPGDDLWWLEGVTEYYANVFEVRAKLNTPEGLLKSLSFYPNALNQGNYLRVSLRDSGRRVWESRGSSGYGGVNYYLKGLAVGFLLDIQIRKASEGRASLDNVMVDLYKETKKEGYPPGRIRALCVKHGGEITGQLYDLAVDSVQPLPWEQVLADTGLGESVDREKAVAKKWPY